MTRANCIQQQWWLPKFLHYSASFALFTTCWCYAWLHVLSMYMNVTICYNSCIH